MAKNTDIEQVPTVCVTGGYQLPEASATIACATLYHGNVSRLRYQVKTSVTTLYSYSTVRLNEVARAECPTQQQFDP